MSGTDADDWFAEFEREARAAAERREQEAAGTTPPAAGTTPPAAATPPALVPPPAPVPPVLPPAPPLAAGPVSPESPVAPPPVAPDLPPTQAMPTPAWEPAPTQALSASDLAASLAGDARPPAAEVVPFGAAPPTADGAPESALDALFAEDRFREYADGPDPSESPFAARSRSTDLVAVDGAVPPPPRRRLPRALLWAGGGVLAVLALVLLFLIGTRLPDLLGPAPAVVAPSASPSPTPTALPVGPVPPGDYRWNELLGGECLAEFTDAWQDEYVVVDCDEAHPAQLVLRAWFPPAVPDPDNPVVGKPTDPFPGVEAIEAQITLLCQAPGVVDLAAAGDYLDVVTSASYPLTAEEWDEDPSYYCFVSRSSGEPLTGSLAPARTPTPGG